MINSDSKTSKIKIQKRSESIPQSLLKPEYGILKSKSQKNKTVVASCESKPKGAEPKVLVNQKILDSHHKVQEVKSKTSSTNLKWPIKQWVPKSENVNTAYMPKSKGKAKIIVPRQWLLKTYDRREVYVLHPYNERRGNVKFGGNQSGKIIGTWTIGNSSISINNVWLVDDLKHNLLSISQFCDNGYDVMFGKTNCTVINKDDNSIVFKGKRIENVYKINFSELVDQKVIYLLSMNDKKWV